MNTNVARPRFQVIAVAALAAALVIGFSRTYYLKFLFEGPPLTQAARLHGLIATVWIALHYTQARLIEAHRVALHKRLGIFGACVAAVLAVQAVQLAIGRVADGHAPPGRNPLQFLSVPLGTTAMFVLFVATALAMRHKREWHKRLMLLATMTLLMPAMGRLDLQIMTPLGLPRTWLPFAVTAGFLAWAWVHDWRHLGRVHPAYLVGGITLLASMWGRKWIGMTDAWTPIAQWLVS